MRLYTKVFLAAMAVLALASCRNEYHFPEDSVSKLFEAGKEGYHTYRIPAMVVSSKGTLLAFSEGRVASHKDGAEKDIVVKRSSDGGKTWGDLIVVRTDSVQSCGNPVPIVMDNGRLVVFSLWSNRLKTKSWPLYDLKAFIQHSDDDGLTWSKPREVTVQQPADSNWIMYAMGPGHGLQLTKGEHAGRLVVPCYHKWLDKDRKWQGRSFLMVSDDLGETWKQGAFASPGGNECSATELSNGDIMLNMREFTRWREEHLVGNESRRLVAISRDGGETLDPCRFDWGLPEPRCQGSIIRYKHGHENEDWLLFVNPTSVKKRYNLQVKLSKDGGHTWKPIYKAPFTMCAYSDIAELPDGSVALIYEAGEETMRECLAFDIIPAGWIK